MTTTRKSRVKDPITSGVNVGLSDVMVTALDTASECSGTKPSVYARIALRNRLVSEGYMPMPESMQAMLAKVR
jgi:hypothetical protein